MKLSLVLAALLAIPFAHAGCGDTVVSSGGVVCVTENAPCCDCLDTPGKEQCIWDVGAHWCKLPLVCDSNTDLCMMPPAPVVDQSGGCGAVSQRCCPGGECTDALVCASGSCIDITSDVSEQSVCGLEATACCGYYEDCDENLVCVDSVCTTVETSI